MLRAAWFPQLGINGEIEGANPELNGDRTVEGARLLRAASLRGAGCEDDVFRPKEAFLPLDKASRVW